jgi:type II secretory pathway pseudopilin PulG
LTGRRYQAGASGVLIVALLVLVLVGVIASSLLSRIGTSGRDDSATATRLAVAADALEGYAAASQRLPCPADPTLDTGEESPVGGAATCTFPDGTVPWKTIGMRRDDSFDSWGRKISYRVYTGEAGSLTQPRGVSMVECDTDGIGAVTTGAGSAGGLCDSQTRVTLRDTSPANFFLGQPHAPPGKKGLTLDDLGILPLRDDVAYVLISHGATGLGGYTVSGARLDLPNAGSSERGNTNATGPFAIKAFSDADTAATAAAHFDDLLVYRTLPELVKRIGLSARNWPEEAGTGITFNQASVEAAVGHAVLPDASLGQTSVTFGAAQVSGIGAGGVATDVSFDVTAGVGGIGAGSAGNTMLQSSADEFLRVVVDRATTLAVTLGDFGTGAGLVEQVEFKFYLAGTQVGSPIVKPGCRPDGGLASFSIPAGSQFDQIDITPKPSTDGGTPVPVTGITAFLLTEIKTCTALESPCVTAQSQPPNAPNTCP